MQIKKIDEETASITTTRNIAKTELLRQKAFLEAKLVDVKTALAVFENEA